MALAHIRKSGGLLIGEGMATAGLVMGYVSLLSLFLIIPMLAAIALPSFVKARDVSQKNACIYGQRRVQDAVEQWSMNENASLGDVIDGQDVLNYLVGRERPACPASQRPIEIPERVGDPVLCPTGIESHQLDSHW